MALFGKKKAAKESCPPKKGGGPAEPQLVLKQERSTQDTFQHVFFLQLLFRKMPMSPSSLHFFSMAIAAVVVLNVNII